MSTLIINKVGPIGRISFKLNRINCFIGPQSSGKSTIAKIISFCLWLEKDILIHRNTSYVDADFIYKNLLVFHQMEHAFTEESFIKYKSTILSLEYRLGKPIVTLEEGFAAGVVGKNAYIPAERNVITLPGIFTLPLGNTNLKSFLLDWSSIHNKYTQHNSVDLLDLNVKYYYDDNKQQDTLVLKNGKPIPLLEASSGLQSVTPLALCVDYLTNWIYQHTNDTSVEMRKELEYAILTEFMKLFPSASYSKEDMDKFVEDENFKNIFKANIGRLKLLSKEVKDSDSVGKLSAIDSFFQLEENITKPHFSSIIIEEPEQNLFPQTQVSLVRYILKKINKDRDNLVITTHSPYILYALNNCMLGGLVKDNMEEEDMLATQDAWVHPQQVSVWALTADGNFLSVEGSMNETLQDKDGLIRKNYLDDCMRSIMGEFTNLLNYYE